ncbi:2,3-dimethylmalate lyase [Pseudomonas tolaasii]
MISVKIADRIGFPVMYMTGYGTVGSNYGLPDAGLATYSEMVRCVETMAQGTKAALIADADTGFGGLLNIERTVRGYERAGAAAIQLEDQEFPKRCGHLLGRRVVSIQDMVRKVKVARDSRDSSDFLIIARTDARTSLGLDEALRRGEAYAEAGADMLFIESPESIEEMQKIGETFDLPLVANIVEGGRTPVLSAADLKDLGYSLAIFPALGFLAAGQALDRAYRHLKEKGSTDEFISSELYNFGEFAKVMGFEAVWGFEQKWGSV